MPSRRALLTPDATDPRTPVVVAARRTPVARAGGALAGHDVTALAAPVLRALAEDLRQLGSDVTVDEVVLGNCTGPGGDPARVAALAAGLGVGVPGVTVDRQCGSGLEAVAVGAHRVLAGGGTVLAGGAESPSTAPLRSLPGPDGAWLPYARARFAPEEHGDPDMGPAADDLARRCGIGRERQDAYALRSHRLALAAAAGGAYDAELVAVGGVASDSRPRAGLRAGQLARFRPAFSPDGTVTVGNACGIDDGAAAVALVEEGARAELGVPGLAVRAYAAAGVDPRLPGLGPAPAVRAVLDAARLDVREAALEVTEAFAAQLLACTDALGVDAMDDGPTGVCTQGGAIALGHPWGTSGALLVVRLLARMVRTDGPRFGVAACAVGGGQGVAMLVERVG